MKSRPEEGEHLHGSLNRSSTGIRNLECTGRTGMQTGCFLYRPVSLKSISDQPTKCRNAVFEVPEMDWSKMRLQEKSGSQNFSSQLEVARLRDIDTHIYTMMYAKELSESIESKVWYIRDVEWWWREAKEECDARHLPPTFIISRECFENQSFGSINWSQNLRYINLHMCTSISHSLATSNQV